MKRLIILVDEETFKGVGCEELSSITMDNHCARKYLKIGDHIQFMAEPYSAGNEHAGVLITDIITDNDKITFHFKKE